MYDNLSLPMIMLLGEFVRKVDEGFFCAKAEEFNPKTVEALVKRGLCQYVADGSFVAPTTKGIITHLIAARKPLDFGPSPLKDKRQMPLPLEVALDEGN